MRNCINVSIIDDRVIEETESFFIKLIPVIGEDLRIIVDPQEREVFITDSVGKSNGPC